METATKLSSQHIVKCLEENDELWNKLEAVEDALTEKYKDELNITCTNSVYVDNELAVLVSINPSETAEINLPYSYDDVRIYYEYGLLEEWVAE